VPQLRRDETLAYLRESKDRLESEDGVRRIGLLGSFFSGHAAGASDLDALAEMDAPTFKAYWANDRRTERTEQKVCPMGSFICAFLILIAGCATIPERPELPEFVLAAHRGVVTEEFQENSLASLEETISRGYTHIEVDVCSTKDGYPVCLHDGNLQRTCGINDNVSSLTLAQLRELAPEERLPSFETFCARCEGRIDLMPDIKHCPQALFDAFIRRVDASMTRHGLVDGALFIGRKRGAGRFQGRARLSWGGSPEEARRHGIDKRSQDYFVFGHAADFQADSVKAFQEMGLPVIVSINVFHYGDAVGDPVAAGVRDVTRMLEYGVDGLQIDSVYEEAAKTGLGPR